MSPVLNQKRGNGGDGSAKVVVAVKASKDISRNGFVWALSHIVQPGDCVTLLVVVPNHASGRKIWGLPILSRDCTNGHRRLRYGTTLDHKSDIVDYCSKMMVQLLKLYDPTNIKIKIKIVSASLCGSVAAESKKAKADWVVLDKHLKHEEKKCIEELRCNIVVMKQNQAKIIRLNLVGSSEGESQLFPTLPPELDKPFHQIPNHVSEASVSNHVMTMISYSSSDLGTLFTSTEPVSSSDAGTSPRSIPEANDMFKKQEALVVREDKNFAVTCSDSDSDTLSPSTALEFQPWVAEILRAACSSSKQADKFLRRLDDKAYNATAKELLDKFSELDMDARISSLNSIRNVREATASSRAKPSTSPSLCSVCLHKAPLFGKPPRWFSYAELVQATGGFSQANFLAEGGFGSVHRGVLSDGQVVAVKQHKLASSQGDVEFCSEVEVLSCAQHRNVVMLIGFCVEDKKRLLVYEYICNGSLDSHLYGRNGDILEWSSRQNIAVGAARGLRYLHEECRVGCIVHRDMRPNNILLTHDFEPLVGDFGLARWQPDGDLGVETRVIGTLGYLAPEYAQSGQITEKADVYSFGVVLLELVTGRKAVDINKPKGQQCLTEWARPLLKQCAIDKLVDPCLENHYSKREVYCMLNAASSCIRRDPHVRPRMSHVLRMLEGDIIVESNCSSLQRGEAGNRSDRLLMDLKQQHRPKDTMRTAYRRDKARRASYGGA